MHKRAFLKFAPPRCWSLIMSRISASEKFDRPSIPLKRSNTSEAIALSKATIEREKQSETNEGEMGRSGSSAKASRRKS